MITGLKNKYYVRKKSTDAWEDVTTKFDGVKVLSISGFNEKGEAVNIYSEQWINSPVEDIMVTTQIEGQDVIIRKNVDLSLTFICGERYGASDTQAVHDAFVDYMCNNGDIYIKSAYTNKQAHVISLKAYKPTTEKLHRGSNSYIMGTIELHNIEPPTQAT